MRCGYSKPQMAKIRGANFLHAFTQATSLAQDAPK